MGASRLVGPLGTKQVSYLFGRSCETRLQRRVSSRLFDQMSLVDGSLSYPTSVANRHIRDRPELRDLHLL